MTKLRRDTTLVGIVITRHCTNEKNRLHHSDFQQCFIRRGIFLSTLRLLSRREQLSLSSSESFVGIEANEGGRGVGWETGIGGLVRLLRLDEGKPRLWQQRWPEERVRRLRGWEMGVVSGGRSLVVAAGGATWIVRDRRDVVRAGDTVGLQVRWEGESAWREVVQVERLAGGLVKPHTFFEVDDDGVDRAPDEAPDIAAASALIRLGATVVKFGIV